MAREVIDPDYLDEDGIPVTLVSGAPFKVLTGEEKDYIEKLVRDYTAAFRWENISDLQDVDRMLILELLVYRYGLWLSKTRDYWDELIDADKLHRSVKETSIELRQLKTQLGVDKKSRDKEHGDESVAVYLEKLRQRAREFGINREKMLDKGIELSQQLIALYTLHKNCTPDEQSEQAARAEDVVNWIGDVFQPEFEAVDAYFREHQQRMWIEEQ